MGAFGYQIHPSNFTSILRELDSVFRPRCIYLHFEVETAIFPSWYTQHIKWQDFSQVHSILPRIMVSWFDWLKSYPRGSKYSILPIAGEAEGHSPPPRMPDEELISVVDQIMEDEDFNRDGYIDYSEFVAAQRATDGPTKIWW